MNWNNVFLGIIRGLSNIGDFFILFTNSLFVRIGAFFSLVFLIIVEIMRVHNGVRLFEGNDNLAWFAASALVIYLGLQEMIIVYIEHKNNYQHDTHYKFSFRLWWENNIKYMFGVSSEDETFKPIPKSPAQIYINLATGIKLGVIVLSLFGSMNYVFYDVLLLTDANLYTTIINALLQGQGEVFFPLISGTLYTVLVVQAVDGLSRYVAEAALETMQKYEHTKLESQFEKAVVDAESAGKTDVAKKVIEAIEAGNRLGVKDKEGNSFIAGEDEQSYYLKAKDKNNSVQAFRYATLADLEHQGMRQYVSDLRKWKVLPPVSKNQDIA